MSKINCSMCKTFKKAFFKNTLSQVTKNSIIVHLIACEHCYEDYKKYAKENNYDFTALDVIMEFDKIDESGAMDDKINEALSNLKKQSDAINYDPFKWQDAVKDNNMEALFTAQFYRDIQVNEMGAVDELNRAEKGFYTHVLSKLAKKVDMLEGCLIKDVNESEVNEYEKLK